MKIEQTPQVTAEMEHFENFERTPEERANYEMMVREDRKNELRNFSIIGKLKHLKSSFSSYLIANISKLVNQIIDNKNINPFLGSDDEFK
jgi:hypothetical protein